MGVHVRIDTYAWLSHKKNLDYLAILHFGVPYVPSDKFSPAKQREGFPGIKLILFSNPPGTDVPGKWVLSELVWETNNDSLLSIFHRFIATSQELTTSEFSPSISNQQLRALINQLVFSQYFYWILYKTKAKEPSLPSWRHTNYNC